MMGVVRPVSARHVRPVFESEAVRIRRPQSARDQRPSSTPGKRPASAGIRQSGPGRFLSYPISSKDSSSIESPMTQALAGTVNNEATNYKDQMLQAAIMRIAPNDRVTPCRNGICCWRWAARHLLDECANARASAHQLREAFEEELGDSILQQLLDLEKSYEQLEKKLHATMEDGEKERRKNVASEKKLKEVQEQCNQALVARDRALSAQERLEKELHDMIALYKAQEAELLQMSAPREQLALMGRQVEELEINARDALAAKEIAEKELRTESTIASELAMKVKQLEVFENQHLKHRQKARREGKSKKASKAPDGRNYTHA